MELTTTQPKDRTTAGFTPSPAEPFTHQVPATLAQYRIASTHPLHIPLRPGRSHQPVFKRLNDPLSERLIGFGVPPQPPRTRLCSLTLKGARRPRDWPVLRGRSPYPITSTTAASLKALHLLTVLRTHLAFAAAARHHGDEHDHLDGAPEVFHAIGAGEQVVADAAMHPPLIKGQQRRKLQTFAEAAPATMSSEHLTAKLIVYARWWTYKPQPASRRRQPATPGWLRWYPVISQVLFVPARASRLTLANRISGLKATTTHHPLVASLARQVPLGITVVLEDLDGCGLTSAAWVPLTGDNPARGPNGDPTLSALVPPLPAVSVTGPPTHPAAAHGNFSPSLTCSLATRLLFSLCPQSAGRTVPGGSPRGTAPAHRGKRPKAPVGARGERSICSSPHRSKGTRACTVRTFGRPGWARSCARKRHRHPGAKKALQW
ncbi:hypothetical protein [Streptomyces sp. NWU49]|uniref:hypothetical protein n=1 Tax=Streptomyces sp. NWU49 TaxID=2201153 RepID=UPI0015E7F795|nr:hypothetical protein [Streptomyces sp. NWU49]